MCGSVLSRFDKWINLTLSLDAGAEGNDHLMKSNNCDKTWDGNETMDEWTALINNKDTASVFRARAPNKYTSHISSHKHG